MSANRLIGLRCKGTTKFADVQIFKGKSERCRGGGYSANERREIGSKVRGKYRMVMDWYRSGNEVVSRKKAERKGFNNTFYIPTDLTDEHG